MLIIFSYKFFLIQLRDRGISARFQSSAKNKHLLSCANLVMEVQTVEVQNDHSSTWRVTHTRCWLCQKDSKRSDKPWMFGITVLAVKYKQWQRSLSGKDQVFRVIKLLKGALLKERNEVQMVPVEWAGWNWRSLSLITKWTLSRDWLKGSSFNITALTSPSQFHATHR